MPWGRKTLVTAVASGLVGVASDDVRLAQDVGEEAMGAQVDVAPVDARPYAGAEGLLHAVHAIDQGREVAVAMGDSVRVMSLA